MTTFGTYLDKKSLQEYQSVTGWEREKVTEREREKEGKPNPKEGGKEGAEAGGPIPHSQLL